MKYLSVLFIIIIVILYGNFGNCEDINAIQNSDENSISQNNNEDSLQSENEESGTPTVVPVDDEDIDKVNVGAVTIEKKTNGRYYFVTIDETQNYNSKEIGKQYGQAILKICPAYEEYLGIYLYQTTEIISKLIGSIFYGKKDFTDRAKEIVKKENFDQRYKEQLDGLASALKGYKIIINKKKLWEVNSEEEIYILNLFSDIFRFSQCSAFGVWGDRSAIGSTIIHRNLDWLGGIFEPLAQIQAFTKIIMKNGRKIYLIGALGHLGCISGISIDKNSNIFGSILDSTVDGTEYNAKNCRSYNFDLRYALENKNTKEEAADYLKDKKMKYACSHLIFFADEKNAIVLENNITNKKKALRAIRTDQSKLYKQIPAWDYPNMLGVVNAFMLDGQLNNFNNDEDDKTNPDRWELLLKKLKEKEGKKLNTDDVKQIMTSFWKIEPKSLYEGYGDIYNTDTQQMMLYVPKTKELQIFFKKQFITPIKPKFEIIKLD